MLRVKRVSWCLPNLRVLCAHNAAHTSAWAYVQISLDIQSCDDGLSYHEKYCTCKRDSYRYSVHYGPWQSGHLLSGKCAFNKVRLSLQVSPGLKFNGTLCLLIYCVPKPKGSKFPQNVNCFFDVKFDELFVSI